ncbi:unannotated protein [freshwater metagenome]|uniref:Unannotated protein n=1 Tax=freshwater metagenome TaxID=449393 RepID=A0A6J7IDZ5_9ZZZZ|nr:hypothetical protein [Actinomycetota bacterium]
MIMNMIDLSKRPVVSAIGHVAIRVKDLGAAVEHATTIMGLRVSDRTADRVDLTEGLSHHSLTYIKSDVEAIDHMGFEAAGPWAVEEIRRRVKDAGLPVLSDRPFDECLSDGFVFEAPGGWAIEIYSDMPHDQPLDWVPSGVRPRRFGHLNIAATDPDAVIKVMCDILDFRVSDHFRGGAFIRCNPEHHGLGVVKGPGKLHHHAWEIENMTDLAHLGDLLDDLRVFMLAGPVRHGMGNNIASYFEGPGQMAVEYYCDMVKIWNDETYEPGVWSEDAGDLRWFTRWTQQVPSPDMRIRQLGLPPAERDGASLAAID